MRGIAFVGQQLFAPYSTINHRHQEQTTMLPSSAAKSLTIEGSEEHRRYFNKVNELLQANVSDHVFLPMIASMGDTSSGKSSVLSSLTNVELPSSDKLTTRCPIMLEMSHSKTKNASVKINWKDSNVAESSRAKFGTKIVDKSNWKKLTSYISLAQKNIIEVTGKQIARDVVHVTIQGPEYVNLTVIDLPGIIRTFGKGESASLAQDTQNLINEYMVNPRCVILAVHPAIVDFHNSSIMADAKKVDPETKRTLPVLTKPDQIDAGAETSVKELLLGEKTEGFQQGFHMVKSRGQAALNSGDTIEQGLQSEAKYFMQTKPWCDIGNRKLFGIPNLRRKLADLQIEMTREALPTILQEITKQKDDASLELSRLGYSLTSPAGKRSFFSEISHQVAMELGVCVSGYTSRQDLNQGHGTPLASPLFHDTASLLSEKLRKGRLYEKPDRDWLCTMIKNNRPFDAPFLGSDEIFRTLVYQFIEQDWSVPCTDMVESISEILKTAASKVVDKESNIASFPRLKRLVLSLVTREIEDSMKETRKEVERVVKREQIPYTQREAAFEHLQSLQGKRIMNSTSGAFNGHNYNSTLHVSTAKQSLENAILKGVKEKSVEECMAEELEEKLSAYGKVAFERIIDIVPMICRDGMVHLPGKARRAFGKVTDSDLEEAIVLSSSDVERRELLENKLEILEKGLAILKDLSY